MPIGKVWIYRLLFVFCWLCVLLKNLWIILSPKIVHNLLLLSSIFFSKIFVRVQATGDAGTEILRRFGPGDPYEIDGYGSMDRIQSPIGLVG